MALCDLIELASRVANPFGHPSQVRMQVLVLKTCVDLRVRLARAEEVNIRKRDQNIKLTERIQFFHLVICAVASPSGQALVNSK